MKTHPSRVATTPDNAPSQRWRLSYVQALNVAFAVFSSTRLVSYLPNIWAIHSSGDSSQHSLWTWLTWMGSHAVMAAWLYENNGRRANKAMVVTVGNALMCLVTCGLVLWYR
jgi:hypothetical protein